MTSVDGVILATNIARTVNCVAQTGVGNLLALHGHASRSVTVIRYAEILLLVLNDINDCTINVGNRNTLVYQETGCCLVGLFI